MLSNKQFYLVRLFPVALLLVVSIASAQASAPPPVVLKNSFRTVETWTQPGTPGAHHPWVTNASLTSSETAATMDFEVALKMRNFSELQARLVKGERISSQEMEAKYDPLPSDEKAMVNWLTSQGFTITRQDSNHLAIFAHGRLTQIRQAMQVNFGRVSYEGKTYTSAITAPSLPASLSASVLGINGLQPHIHPHKHLVKPNSLTGTNAPFLPSQVAKADNATGLYSSNITGAGQSIAIVIDTFPATSDLVSFWKTYSVNQSLQNIQFIQVIPGALPSTSEEETLDTEWSSSIAPGARVRVYATTSLSNIYLDEAYQQVYNDVVNHPEYGLHQMSMSYGEGETYTTSSQVTTDAQYFANLASAGVTVFASSGDGGSTPGTNGGTDSTGPLQVETPSSDVNVTGVGGTSLTLATNGNESNESTWSFSGGGVSIYFSRPSWQTGTGVPTGSFRTVPDVACPADPNTGAVLLYNGAQTVVGGTSWSSPTWAGYCALINQARSNAGLTPVGVLGPKIYPLIGTSNFRDVTSGSNSVGSSSGGKYGASTGYDQVTGIGVPLMQTLTQTLVGTASLIGLQLQPVFQSVLPGTSASFTVSVSGSPASYQWQRMPLGSSIWSNLTDTGAYSGSATATLTVNPATSAMSGDQFQCIVQFASNSVTSAPAAVLTVETPLVIAKLAGTAKTTGSPTSSNFAYPSGVALDNSGNLYVADFNNNVIRKVTSTGGVTTPYGSTAGTAGSTNSTGTNARFQLPNAIATDGANNFYVADSGNNLVRKIVLSTTQVTTFASGFNNPNGVATDTSGNVYVADTGNNIIEKIAPNGTVSTLAGKSGTAGFLNGTGTAAEFNAPISVAVDGSGNVYVADLYNFVVRKITPGGVVTTFAGQMGIGGYMDGPATKALFNAPTGVTVDNSGNVYVTDSLIPDTSSTAAGSNLFRKITPTGAVSTLAGQVGISGSANGSGTAAQFYSVQASAINSLGEFFFADTYNQLIRIGGIAPSIVNPPLGQVITVGQPVTFSITTNGTGPLTYQWLKNGTAISGATSSTFSITSVASGNAGNYSVSITSSFGSATSSAATLIPVNSQPVAQTVTQGQSATFSVNVAVTGTVSYQWLFNGAVISGATGSSYAIPTVSASNAGNYSVAISDASGIVTTNPVSLTVNSVSVIATDTPTMPPWALALLGILLFFTATPLLGNRPRPSSS